MEAVTEILPGQLPGGSCDDTAKVKDPEQAISRETIHTDASHPIHGIGSGDTSLITDFLTAERADEIFNLLQDGNEINYQQWYHMPDSRKPHKALRKLRRTKVAMADPLEDGLIPHYRFPVNDQNRYGVFPFSPTIKALQEQLVEDTGIPFNHSVVLLYRDGEDCIGFHQDKTLDLEDDTPIASISLGAARPYLLGDNARAPKKLQEFLFPHGSLLLLGPKTNREWYHSVRMLDESEGPCGIRISVTFRVVATRRNPKTGEILGKGHTFQTLNWPTELRGLHRSDSNLETDEQECDEQKEG